MTRYMKRIADEALDFRLETFGAVQVEGPKWSGKTTTAERKAKSILKLQEMVDEDASFINMAKSRPSSLLSGLKPRLLDEWQLVPALRDAVRTDVDKNHSPGLYILTGSNSINEEEVKHSGIGRITRMKMYPMALAESGESSGQVSLSSLFNNPDKGIADCISTLSIEELAFSICRGGWPYSLFLNSDKSKLYIAKDYLNGICNIEISTVDGVRRDGQSTRLLLRSYARHVSETATTTTILRDIDTRPVIKSEKTLSEYLTALEKLFVIEDVPAWCPAIRSKTAIRSGVKRGFTDPSIAAAALGIGPEALLKDMRTFGFLFESLVLRDIRAYTQLLDGHIAYYRDRYGIEADYTIHLDDGRFALVECKLGTHQIDQGAENLKKIRDLIRIANEKKSQAPLREPDLMIIITGGKYAYRRDDGIYVIPIGVLGP